MELKDIVFAPHNDMEIDDINILSEHENLIKQNRYDDATALLNNENYTKGFRASLFNSIQNKLRKVQEHILNEHVAESDEYYSYEEPSSEFMEENNYTFWMKIY